MQPRHRQLLFGIAGAVLAVVVGWGIADGSLLTAGLLCGFLALWLSSRACGLPVDVLLCGLVMVGYLVGNRGFAQLHVPQIPLLPGELVLGVGLVIAAWESAKDKALPLRKDALNYLLAAWLLYGTSRLFFDVRIYGFVAIRDFATVYYALFFYLAQRWGSAPTQRHWIERCLTVGFALASPALLAFTFWPEFLVSHTLIFDTPVFFIKSDVESALLVAGVCWFLWRFVTTGHWRWLGLTTLSIIGVALSNSRASFVGLAVVGLWFIVCRQWRSLRVMGGLIAVGALSLITVDFVSTKPWMQTTTFRIYETGASIIDFQGTRPYESRDLGDKPDNNRFRLVWWSTVIEETLSQSPWLGLGFGYDLADKFTRIYYTEDSEEFAVRSPHNFLLTVFGRMGIIGSGLLLMFLGAWAMKTWQAGRPDRSSGAIGLQNFYLWAGAWGILVSACFGVVLEGPMGAIIFWTLLGLANAKPAQGEVPEIAADPALAAPADLHLAEPADEVAASP